MWGPSDERISARRLAVLIEGLPPDSATARKMGREFTLDRALIWQVIEWQHLTFSALAKGLLSVKDRDLPDPPRPPWAAGITAHKKKRKRRKATGADLARIFALPS